MPKLTSHNIFLKWSPNKFSFRKSSKAFVPHSGIVTILIKIINYKICGHFYWFICQTTNWFSMKFCEVVHIILMLLLTKNQIQQVHKFQEKGKMVEDFNGQFLEEYKPELIGIWCIYLSYLDAYMFQISWPNGAWFGRYWKINLCSISFL